MIWVREMRKPGIKITNGENSTKLENRRFFYFWWEELMYELHKSWPKNDSILPLENRKALILSLQLPTEGSRNFRLPMFFTLDINVASENSNFERRSSEISSFLSCNRDMHLGSGFLSLVFLDYLLLAFSSLPTQ